MKRLTQAMVALAMAVAATAAVQVVDQPQARAVTLVSCTGGTGEITFDPPFTTLPAVINTSGELDFASCSGADITGAGAVFDGTVVGGTCVPVLDTLLGTLNAGSITLTWVGGTGPATTTFSWTVPAGMQIGPDTSVIVLVGYSNAGRFHDPLTPAVITYTVTFTDPDQPCPGTSSMQITEAMATVVDVA